MSTPEEIAVGQVIRQSRTKQNLSLAQLAEKTGYSVSYVSQVERGIANPTLASIKRMAEALGFTVGSLLNGTSEVSEEQAPEKDGEVAVLRAGQRRKIVYPGTGIANELLSPDLRRNMEVIWVEAPVGSNSGGHPHRHEGEECGVVIAGAMKFWVNDEVWILRPKDAIYFPSTLPHHWESVGEEDLVAVWIITPPTF